MRETDSNTVPQQPTQIIDSLTVRKAALSRRQASLPPREAHRFAQLLLGPEVIVQTESKPWYIVYGSVIVEGMQAWRFQRRAANRRLETGPPVTDTTGEKTGLPRHRFQKETRVYEGVAVDLVKIGTQKDSEEACVLSSYDTGSRFTSRVWLSE